MIDHLTLRVVDYETSKRFYLAALKPLGYELLMEFEMPGVGKFCGLGVDKKPDLMDCPHGGRPVPRGQHVAFRARKRAEVEATNPSAAGGPQDEREARRIGASSILTRSRWMHL